MLAAAQGLFGSAKTIAQPSAALTAATRNHPKYSPGIRRKPDTSSKMQLTFACGPPRKNQNTINILIDDLSINAVIVQCLLLVEPTSLYVQSGQESESDSSAFTRQRSYVRQCIPFGLTGNGSATLTFSVGPTDCTFRFPASGSKRGSGLISFGFFDCFDFFDFLFTGKSTHNSF